MPSWVAALGSVPSILTGKKGQGESQTCPVHGAPTGKGSRSLPTLLPRAGSHPAPPSQVALWAGQAGPVSKGLSLAVSPGTCLAGV